MAALGTQEFENTLFKAYPNPTENLLTIALQNNAEVIDTVSVYDISGKTMKVQKTANATVVLDLSDLSRGIYFVKVQSEGQEKVLKVVKE